MKKIIQNNISKSALIDSILLDSETHSTIQKIQLHSKYMKTYKRPGRWIYVERLIFNPEYQVLLDNYQKWYSQFLHWWLLLRIEAIEVLFSMIRKQQHSPSQSTYTSNKRAFQFKANCPLVNRHISYIYGGGVLSEQVHVGVGDPVTHLWHHG